MTFKTDAQRRAAFSHMGGATGNAPRQRKPKALRMQTPLLPMTAILAEVQRYEGRPMPARLLQQLGRHGSEVLKKAGYTTGLDPLRLPAAGLQRGQAGAVLRGQTSLPTSTRALPTQGVQKHRLTRKREAQLRRAQWHRVAKLGAIAAALGAGPAAYALLRTGPGRSLATRALAGFHPLKPLTWALKDAETLAPEALGGRVRTVSSGLIRGGQRTVDTLFNKLVGEGETPGLIDRVDTRLKRGLARVARRAHIPVSTPWQTALPAVKRSRRLWEDFSKTGTVRGMLRVPALRRGKPLLHGAIPSYENAYVSLRRLTPTLVRRRRLR